MSYIGNEPVVSATRTITEVVASGSQTVFYPNGGYTVGYLDVIVNGSQLQSNDFVATNGTSVTLNVACAAGDDVRMVAYGTFTTSSSYTQAQIDSKIGASQFGFKNRIINGAMMIDQRNAGASVSVSDAQDKYPVDRFYIANRTGTGVFTGQQTTASNPAGYKSVLGVTTSTANASLSATQWSGVRHSIEGLNVADLSWGTANAATVTLSFWVRSSLTGTFGGSLVNASFNRSYPFTYTIISANTWEQKTVTIAGDQSGTWATDNTAGIHLFFGLGVGSTYSGTAGSWAGAAYYSATGATSVVGTSGATFYITGVQLEKGSTATAFDYRPYGTELALCQRYYEFGSTFSGPVPTTQTPFQSQSFIVTKRAAPSMSVSANTSVTGGAAGTSYYSGTGQQYMPDTTKFTLYNGTLGSSIGATWTASAEL